LPVLAFAVAVAFAFAVAVARCCLCRCLFRSSSLSEAKDPCIRICRCRFSSNSPNTVVILPLSVVEGARPPHPYLPQTAIPQSRKNKVQKPVLFLKPKIVPVSRPRLPHNHHMFTTIYHHAAPQNPQKTLQNSHSTTPEFTAAKPEKGAQNLHATQTKKRPDHFAE
jgi:hypothetical protein